MNGLATDRVVPWAREIVRQIFERYPEARDHLPGDNLQIAVIVRGDVQPDWYFAVTDEDLIAEARGAIGAARAARLCADIRMDRTPDAVLVLAPTH